MELVALAIPLIYIAVHGFVRQVDEGAEAHLWQLLMVAQIPFVAYFAVKWLPRAPKSALTILALQAGIVIAAFAAVFILEHAAR